MAIKTSPRNWKHQRSKDMLRCFMARYGKAKSLEDVVAASKEMHPDNLALMCGDSARTDNPWSRGK